MQVLNSPSREEVNAAHFSGSWMGIGVPSVRNAFRVSKFKTCCWIVLLLSSIPIHLVFNSTIFETDHRESDYHLTIASEAFTHGGAFFPPGASLAIPGLVSDDAARAYADGTRMGTVFGYSSYSPQLGYGSSINISDYDYKQSPAVLNISAAARSSGNWERLEVKDCVSEYLDCQGLKKYRDVVLVAEKPDGWFRNDIWHLMDNETEFWDRYVPADTPNNLFFDAQCSMTAQHTNGERTHCYNECNSALGLGGLSTEDFYNYGWHYPFFSDFEFVLNIVNRSLVPSEEDDLDPESLNVYNVTTSGLQPGSYNISVNYCLVEPLENVCHIALSPTLLIGVTICVVVKTITAIVVTVVLSRRNQTPLVTLGDAMASFIEKPDRVTAGLCTVGQEEIRKAMRSKRAFVLPGPRQWDTTSQKRRASAVPVSVWVTSYLLFLCGIAIIVGFFYNAYQTNGNLTGEFFESDGNSFIPLAFSLTEAVLLANSPQLLLSFCYLAYNNLFTRLQMAREWALFSDGYHPLRVTSPKGKQYSTYRLQLPYKYSLPLIAVSIFLHWLLSNTIYVFVSIGGYYGTDDFLESTKADPSLPSNTAIAVGYSTLSLLVMMVVSIVLIFIPPMLSLKRLPSNINNPGSNSLALSAACHPSKMSYAVSKPTLLDSPTSPSFQLPPSPYMPVRPGSPAEEGYDMSGPPNGNRHPAMFEMQTLGTRELSQHSMSSSRQLISQDDEDDAEAEQREDSENGGEEGSFGRLARSELRWGVIEMPPEWCTEYDGDGPVEHLGFGVEEDKVSSPVAGRFYA
ncbi:hypothetical protein F5X99DRAFT_353108 [Biscogniauxia marginata]|nr:hypothetical protein F5X99DRAFT_353108 [Biscogniauxia marginata]